MDTLNTDFQFADDVVRNIQSKDFLLKLEREIVKNLRQEKSQEYMNRKLEYNFNQYAKWENGTKKILWNDVMRVAKIQKINIAKPLSLRFSFHQDQFEDSGVHIVKLFQKVFFNGELKSLARYLETKVPYLREILKGQNSIPFNLILKLFLYRPVFFLYFLQELKIIQCFSEFYNEFKKLESHEQLEAQYPFTSIVLYFTDTTQYRNLKIHSSKFIVKHTGLTLAQVEMSLRELKSRNLISLVNNKYLIEQRASELKSLTIEQLVKIISYWNLRGVSYLHRKIHDPSITSTKNHTSFRVFTTTKKVSTKINEKLAQTYYEINQLIKETIETQDDEIVLKVLYMQCFGVEESQPYHFETDFNYGFIKKP